MIDKMILVLFGLHYSIAFYLIDKMTINLILSLLSFLTASFYYFNFHCFSFPCDTVE